MALMFARLARNFIKNGYFPTDEVTLARILSAVEPCASGSMRILDPCAGEGVALAETAHHLDPSATLVESCGVEYDEERAWHAKTLLDRCIRGDLFSTQITLRSVGLMWFNPPYGDLVSDKALTADRRFEGRNRLEKLFYERCVRLLQPDGVIVMILPYYTLDAELCGWIAGHFRDVEVYLAPEQQFKQCVVFGYRRRNGDGRGVADTRKRLLGFAQEEALRQVLPEIWTKSPYVVPPVPAGEFQFWSQALDARQLAVEVQRFPTLWGQFDTHFSRFGLTRRSPLRTPSDWHLALMLAAGDISGVVTARDGRKFVVKGSCHKEKSVKVGMEPNEKGGFSEIRTLTDMFVSEILAVDMTPGSDTFGRTISIR